MINSAPTPIEPKIDVFILSCNRAEYLAETLACFRNQTFQDFRLIVLDNASRDNTPEVVAEAAQLRPVELIQHPTNIGAQANFFQIKTLARADWVMAFHDDDLIHPRFLEYALERVQSDPKCRLCSTNYVGRIDPSPRDFEEHVSPDDYWHFRSAAHFASFCYTLNQVCLAGCLYPRAAFLELSQDLAGFGKMWDRPVMIDAIRDGTAVVFKTPMVLYRLHAGQDSQTPTSGPFLKEAIALTRYFRKIMGDDLRTSSGRCFIVNNRAYLRGLYKWCSDRNLSSFNRFVQAARQSGAATRWSFLPRPVMRLAKKALLCLDSEFF